MSETESPSQRTDWRRIGLIATILFVPGGFVLGGILAARRLRASTEGNDDASPSASPEPHAHEE